MIVEIRLSKRYDMDLIALADAGYRLSQLMKEAVRGYANGIPVHFYIDEVIPFDEKDKKGIHFHLQIPDSDERAVYLIKHIKRGYRNSFCKMCLRNALIGQNLSSYIAEESLLTLQRENLEKEPLSSIPNLKPCSYSRNKKQQMSVLGTTVSRIQTAPVYSIPQPQAVTPVTITQPPKPVLAQRPADPVAKPILEPDPVPALQQDEYIKNESQIEPVMPGNGKALSDDELMAIFDGL